MEDNYKANCKINKIKGKFADLQKDRSSSEEKVAKLQLDLSPSQEPFGACFGENEDSQDLFDSEEPKNFCFAKFNCFNVPIELLLEILTLFYDFMCDFKINHVLCILLIK